MRYLLPDINSSEFGPSLDQISGPENETVPVTITTAHRLYSLQSTARFSSRGLGDASCDSHCLLGRTVLQGDVDRDLARTHHQLLLQRPTHYMSSFTGKPLPSPLTISAWVARIGAPETVNLLSHRGHPQSRQYEMPPPGSWTTGGVWSWLKFHLPS